MGVAVTFDYNGWSASFPTFSNVTEGQITGIVLTVAQQYCRNDGGGPVTDATLQLTLLNLMVAHCAQLMFGSTTAPASAIVGHITNAAQGSVSVAAEMPASANAAWFMQTQWGAMYWQMTAPFRTARYVPGAQFSQYGRYGMFRGY